MYDFLPLAFTLAALVVMALGLIVWRLSQVGYQRLRHAARRPGRLNGRGAI